MRFPKKHVLNGTTCQDQRHLLIDRIAFAAAMPLLEMRIWRMRIPRDFAMEIPGTYWKMMENVDLFPPNFLILWTDVVKSIKPKPLMVYAIGFTIWSLKKTKLKKKYDILAANVGSISRCFKFANFEGRPKDDLFHTRLKQTTPSESVVFLAVLWHRSLTDWSSSKPPRMIFSRMRCHGAS